MNRVLLAAIITTLVILASLAHLALADPQPITLKVRPSVGFEPLDVRLELRVHPIDTDRWILVETSGGEFYRSSEFPVNGENSPKLYSWVWPACYGGDYQIYARIGDGRLWRASVHEPLTVLPR